MPILPKPNRPYWITKPKPKKNVNYDTVYNTVRWRKLRRIRLNYEPLCRECKKVNKVTAANEVDHIVPMSQGGEAWSLGNLQSLCKSCHSRKTMNEIHNKI